MKRLLPLLAAAAVGAGSLVAVTQVVDSPARYLSGTVVIGINGTLPGWSEPKDHPTGFDAALATFLAEKYHFDISWYPLAPNERENALVDGVVDLVIANFSMSGESARNPGQQRDQTIDFAGPYFRDRSGVLVDSTKRAKVTGGKPGIPAENLCVGSGTTGEENSNHQARRMPQAECFAAFSDVNTDTIGVMTDQGILTEYAAARSGGKVVPAFWEDDDHPINDKEFYGIGIPDGSTALCQELTRAINEFLTNGRWGSAFSTHLTHLGEKDFHKPDESDPSRCV
ncbi:transporter substrate-binding domain-containing protein [Actinokineospora auranticolor]|uniref:Glutamate transport system substrate-binding protein n=1 Tax=Actinokineospora auranticolor TaxID=155976 RepID=A0A2S6GF19_9PSEU|nr:transporter substrate-binding domain-containing protein [Actinokineospora auranticolor]PPK63809.1 glutamate transport system substrate-binding protein [Actinokineospora auranticolor]